jgi:hypothetical protein
MTFGKSIPINAPKPDNSDSELVIIGQAKPDLDRNNFKGNQKQDQFQVFPIFQQVPPEEVRE